MYTFILYTYNVEKLQEKLYNFAVLKINASLMIIDLYNRESPSLVHESDLIGIINKLVLC